METKLNETQLPEGKNFCPQCNILYEPGRKNKKYCSRKCYFVAKHKIATMICKQCSKQFDLPYARRGQPYCSKACANSATKKKQLVTIQCAECKNEFAVKQSLANIQKYCSWDCRNCAIRNEWTATTNICQTCNVEFTVKYRQRNKRFCSRRCAMLGENNPRYKKPGTMLGKIAWNHGLTKDESPSLAMIGKKISAVMKEKFKRGELSRKGENNPMFGRKKETMSVDTIERYRAAAIDRVVRGVSGYKTGHIVGEYRSTKTLQVMRFKSSWELAAMMHFDKNDDISCYFYEPKVFTLNDGRKAIPDFIVYHKDGTKHVYEIKPTSIQMIPNVSFKLSLIKESVVAEGYTYVLLGDTDIKTIIRELGETYNNAVNEYKNRCQGI